MSEIIIIWVIKKLAYLFWSLCFYLLIYNLFQFVIKYIPAGTDNKYR